MPSLREAHPGEPRRHACVPAQAGVGVGGAGEDCGEAEVIYYQQGGITLRQGHVIDELRALPAGSIQVCVTSPPFYALRDYQTGTWEGGDPGCRHVQRRGHCIQCEAIWVDQQIGLEPVPDCLGWATGSPCGECYVCRLVEVFRAVRRVLRDDGCLLINLGDSYAANRSYQVADSKWQDVGNSVRSVVPNGLKPKDLMMIPARVALALQADGWYLRSEMVGCKIAPMPESVTDRPTSATEKVFLFSKQARYYYDNVAVAEPTTEEYRTKGRIRDSQYPVPVPNGQEYRKGGSLHKQAEGKPTRNMRNWFLWYPESYDGAHFAVFPQRIPEMAILAGSSARGACAECGAPWRRVVERRLVESDESRPDRGVPGRTGKGHNKQRAGDPESTTTGWTPTCTCNCPDVRPCVILDPFVGSGTSMVVAQRLARHGVGIDLQPDYLRLAIARLPGQQAMVMEV
ncbi:MAG: site-specific DNA-methyltransferase [Chloroflexota bacterium]